MEGEWRDSWHGLCARRAPTVKLWSLDARNGDHTPAAPPDTGKEQGNLLSDARTIWLLPLEQSGENLKAFARANGAPRVAGEKVTRSVRSRPHLD
ncbi:MAG: hypothetical protein ABIQ24_07025 [Nitrospiraceae bacterium]